MSSTISAMGNEGRFLRCWVEIAANSTKTEEISLSWLRKQKKTDWQPSCAITLRFSSQQAHLHTTFHPEANSHSDPADRYSPDILFRGSFKSYCCHNQSRARCNTTSGFNSHVDDHFKSSIRPLKGWARRYLEREYPQSKLLSRGIRSTPSSDGKVRLNGGVFCFVLLRPVAIFYSETQTNKMLVDAHLPKR